MGTALETEEDCTPIYSEGAIVPAEYGWLPRPLDKVGRLRGGPWEKTTVKSVFHNFVAYAGLERYGATHGRNLSLIPGRVFQARFAKKATKQTWMCTFMILAVGVLYGKTANATKYRAAVVSRKVNEDPEYAPGDVASCLLVP